MNENEYENDKMKMFSSARSGNYEIHKLDEELQQIISLDDTDFDTIWNNYWFYCK
jgi:hypothetical protein